MSVEQRGPEPGAGLPTARAAPHGRPAPCLHPYRMLNTHRDPARRPTAARPAEAAVRQSAVFPTFMSALGATPNTDYGRQIVEALKLAPTLSNPKLAITVFMPEDKVGGAARQRSSGRQQHGGRHSRRGTLSAAAARSFACTC